ncbi:MAG: RIO kinase 1 [Candidatus Nanohaloarchaea archaeon]|jgi:RIO kinase 1
MNKDPRDFDERWREESRRMFDTSEARKAIENVLDDQTMDALLELKQREVIKKMYGTIESGKESVVFLADTYNEERVLVKIYMTQAGSFRNMKNYLRGDKRFRNFKDDRRSVINEWCKKEFKNLKKASNILKCPKPIAFEENILVMEFIGRGFSPFPKLKDVAIDNPEKAFEVVLNSIESLWREEKLVHGDLSEYNVLVTDESELVWIDFSQGVHNTHPEAEELLRRDIENVANFFRRQGAQIDEEEAFQTVLQQE